APGTSTRVRAARAALAIASAAQTREPQAPRSRPILRTELRPRRRASSTPRAPGIRVAPHVGRILGSLLRRPLPVYAAPRRSCPPVRVSRRLYRLLARSEALLDDLARRVRAGASERRRAGDGLE